ncbi:MAG: RagB/SusD family nutrient uptake outer membrane protein [Candidatus Neomarinimicrobiota bacterium]
MKDHRFRFLVPFLVILLASWSCTDLEEEPFGVVTPGNFYQTEGELIAAVIPVFNSLGAASWGDYAHVQAVSSDAIFVPTRGGDWDDGGIWRELQLHTWTPTLGFLNGAWNGAYGGVARANSTLDAMRNSPQSETELVKTFIAEVRVLRALYYWWLIDLYGDVPLVTDAATDPDNPPSQSSRKVVFDFIVSEVKDALPDLEDSFGAGGYGRVTTGAANALLATVYLNAEVYTGSEMWQETIDASDEIIESGLYELMSTFDDVFALENEGIANTENILVYATRPEAGVSFIRHMATLHYNQIPASPWNGFSVLADFYNAFDADDTRRDQLLVGQQFVLGGPSAGDSAFDRVGEPLVFTVDAPLIDATEHHGVRMLKWPIDPDMSGADGGNDYAVFRYSHILLAKAEAQFNLNGGGIDLVNQVRERAGLDALSSIDSDAILAERGYEFVWEGFRRQDLIRADKFLDAWTLKDADDGSHRLLFPIPQIQRDANPNLNQNDGY